MKIREFEQAYMSGKTDNEIAKETGCPRTTILTRRKKLEWPSNRDLFRWQRKLKPSEFKMIPEKYRDPKLCLREVGIV